VRGNIYFGFYMCNLYFCIVMIAWIQIDGESKNKTKLKNESNGFFENGLNRITVVYKTDNVNIYTHRLHRNVISSECDIF